MLQQSFNYFKENIPERPLDSSVEEAPGQTFVNKREGITLHSGSLTIGPQYAKNSTKRESYLPSACLLVSSKTSGRVATFQCVA